MTYFEEMWPAMEQRLRKSKIARLTSLSEDTIRQIVAAGGGTYKGLQEGYKGISPQVLFTDRSETSTLAIKVDDLSVSAVMRRINKYYEENEKDIQRQIAEKNNKKED